MLLHYLVKVDNRIFFPNFHVERDNNVTCHKNIALMILLEYVYNIRRIAYKERRRCEDNHGEKNRYDVTTFK